MPWSLIMLWLIWPWPCMIVHQRVLYMHIARMRIGGIWPISVWNVLHAHTYHSAASSFDVCSLHFIHHSCVNYGTCLHCTSYSYSHLLHLISHRLNDGSTHKSKHTFFSVLFLNHVQNDNRKILREIGMGCVVAVDVVFKHYTLEFSLFAAIISITDHFRFSPELTRNYSVWPFACTPFLSP